MAKKIFKKCVSCGESFSSDDKDTILFKFETDNGETVRLCSNCIKKCQEIFTNKIKQDKIKELGENPMDMTPQEIKNKLDEWVLDQDLALKRISKEYYNHLKRLRRFDMDPEANKRLRVDKSNMIYCGPTGVGKTEAIRALASFMDLPYVIEDSSSFTSAGLTTY